MVPQIVPSTPNFLCECFNVFREMPSTLSNIWKISESVGRNSEAYCAAMTSVFCCFYLRAILGLQHDSERPALGLDPRVGAGFLQSPTRPNLQFQQRHPLQHGRIGLPRLRRAEDGLGQSMDQMRTHGFGEGRDAGVERCRHGFD